MPLWVLSPIASCQEKLSVPMPSPIAAVCLLVLCLFSGLTLLVLDSSLCKDNALMNEMGLALNDQCGLATGARCVISATLCFGLWPLCAA